MTPLFQTPTTKLCVLMWILGSAVSSIGGPEWPEGLWGPLQPGRSAIPLKRFLMITDRFSTFLQKIDFFDKKFTNFFWPLRYVPPFLKLHKWNEEHLQKLPRMKEEWNIQKKSNFFFPKFSSRTLLYNGKVSLRSSTGCTLGKQKKNVLMNRVFPWKPSFWRRPK